MALFRHHNLFDIFRPEQSVRETCVVKNRLRPGIIDIDVQGCLPAASLLQALQRANQQEICQAFAALLLHYRDL